MQDSEKEITLLLDEIAAGNETAKEDLMRHVYAALRKKAGALMAGERINHSLQPTALVHEAYFKLFVGKPLQAPNRAYFFGAAARAMRQILVDHARRFAARPEGGRVPVLDGILETVRSTYQVDVLDLDCALAEFGRLHERQSEVVTLRFFGGLQWNEIGICLGVSTATVEKDWQAARAWLYARLKENDNDIGTMGANQRGVLRGS